MSLIPYALTRPFLFGLDAEEILYRLYHQDKVRVFDPQAIE